MVIKAVCTKYTKSKWKSNGFNNERNNEGVMGPQRKENI